MGDEERRLQDHARVDDGLKAAFGEPGGSALDVIERISGTRSRILLRDAPEDASPMVRVAGPTEERAVEEDARYQVLGEIGRGGMGVVYKGRDKDLGRDVALKVLRADLAEEPTVVQRFVEEAQVGGQLQHPGIVPIYGLGLQDGRPYFAMKLIKGETLASLLEGGTKGSELIRVFERVAQTVAYAHSRGVIHRDLKPSNVMVGAFGEVQVVDWGFAKVLGREETHARPGVTMVATVRTGTEGSQSVAGSVMGTPAYMPAEQAMGQIEELTERSDVFALGAILCEVLTRQPPYTGTMQDQLLAAVQARLEDAYARLDGCSAPDALKQLARDCLGPLPKDRPKDAGVVAQRVAEHLSSVEERARQADVDAVHAASEARRVQRARRTTLVLAAVLLVGILGGSGGLLAWKSEERARATAATERVVPLLREATRFQGEMDWPRARAAASTALELAQTERADGETLATARTLHARIDAEAAEEKAREEKLARETRLLKDLDELRMLRRDLSAPQAEQGYHETFAAFGVDPDGVGAAAALADFGRLVELAVHLDGWLRLRFREGDDRWRTIDRLARALDDDPWRTRLRDTVEAGDLAGLRDLATEADPEVQQAATLCQLADALQRAGDAEAAAALLRRVAVLDPGDLWIRDSLSQILWWDLQRASEAMPHAQAAVAIRPQSGSAWNTLGAIRNDGLKDHEGAIRAFRKAIELAPGSAFVHANLSAALRGKGDLDGALAASRVAIRLDPSDATHQVNLGVALMETGDPEGALAAYREAIRIDAKHYRAWVNMGVLLCDRFGRTDDAIAAYREGIRIDPNRPVAYNNLGNALRLTGDFDGAAAAYREAIRLDPKYPAAYGRLGHALAETGDLEGALAAYREALRLDPGADDLWITIGALLCDRLGRYDEAIAAFREAIRIDANLALAHGNLGLALRRKGDRDGALAAFREAIRLDPSDACGLYNLGHGLMESGDFEGAVTAFREVLRIDPKYYNAWICIGSVLSDRFGRYDEAIAAYREAILIEPSRAEAHNNIGVALRRKGDFDGAVAACREAVRLGTTWATAHANLGFALLNAGDFEGAVAAFREVLRIEPNHYNACINMGVLLYERLGRYDEAITAFREAIRIDANRRAGHTYLGVALLNKGDFADSLRALRKAAALESSVNGWLASVIGRVERLAAAEARLPAVLKGEDRPASGQEWVSFAEILYHRKDYVSAVRFYAKGFEADPCVTADLHAQQRLLAACCAALAGKEWHGQALAWLRADLDANAAALASDASAAPAVADRIRQWKSHRDLAGVRDFGALPEEWRALWSDVDALLARAKGGSK